MFSDPTECAEINKSVPMVNCNWIPIATPDYMAVVRAIGVPLLIGPLPFVTLLAAFLCHDGGPAFMNRIKGTVFADRDMGAFAWMHLEETQGTTRYGGDAAENVRLMKSLEQALRAKGFKRSDARPQAVLPAAPPRWKADAFMLPPKDRA